MKRWLLGAALAACTSLAQATGVPVFDVRATIGFVQGTETCPGFTCPGDIAFAGPLGGGLWNEIEWVTGPPAPESMLTLMDLTPTQVNVNGAPVPVSMPVHDNDVIAENFSFGIDVSYLIELYDGAVLAFQRAGTTLLNLNETVNAGVCSVVLGAPCADFWSVTQAIFDGVDQFNYGGFTYDVTFDRTDFVNAIELAATTVAVAENDVGSFKGTVQVARVSEPNPLALLGAGLLAWIVVLHFNRRRYSR